MRRDYSTGTGRRSLSRGELVKVRLARRRGKGLGRVFRTASTGRNDVLVGVEEARNVVGFRTRFGTRFMSYNSLWSVPIVSKGSIETESLTSFSKSSSAAESSSEDSLDSDGTPLAGLRSSSSESVEVVELRRALRLPLPPSCLECLG